MDLKEIKKSSLLFTPAVIIDGFIGSRGFKFLNKTFFLFSVVLITSSSIFFFFSHLLPDSFLSYEYKIYGLSMISLAFWSISFSIYSFSNYFRFLDISLSKKERERQCVKVSYEISKIIHQTGKKDPAVGFIISDFGRGVFSRCGVSEDKLQSFISKKKEHPDNTPLINQEKNLINAYDYAKSLYKSDEDFKEFIFKVGLLEKEFLGAAHWFDNVFVKTRKAERWWSEENISKIQPIASDWAYGVAYELQKFSQPIESLVPVSESLENFHKKEIASLEVILSRTDEANALLVGEAGTGKMAVVGGLASRINNEKIGDRLISKKILVLETGRFVAENGNKTDFERKIIKLMDQTERAGNIIMVIDNLPYLIKSALSFESDVLSLIENYLVAPDIKILALTDKTSFHNLLEPDSTVMSKFEHILLEDIKEEMMITVLEDKLLNLEREYKIKFTYPALVKVVNSANRYFTEGVMPDKAIDLLEEIAPFVVSKDKKIVEKMDVDDFVKEKTGIPVGTVSEEEKNLLSQLEEILHERVVGQERAISSISNSIKRARSGISNPNKPLGSFLFLGPTGVGKTETSKALAEVFFESSDNMSRLDMSEYQGPDALNRLIGSFESGRSGRLSSVLREKPYSVLLLDEFEKSDQDVQNLFLQTLDEGVFSDSSGKAVNARNSIIIATSNAGSDLIWEYENKGEDLEKKKEDIIDAIIERGIFSPELLNRFDAVIVFHPLRYKHLKEIADLEISKLKKRVKERGFEVNVSEDVVDYLIKMGLDPKFGARALNRAIQEKLEKAVAEKIIMENPKPGSVLKISTEDIS